MHCSTIAQLWHRAITSIASESDGQAANGVHGLERNHFWDSDSSFLPLFPLKGIN